MKTDGEKQREMADFLKDLGCKKRGEKFILDEFNHDFYLMFDAQLCEETPQPGTVDIHVIETGEGPSSRGIRLVADANRQGVMRMLAAIGIQEFSEQTKTAFYQLSNPLR